MALAGSGTKPGSIIVRPQRNRHGGNLLVAAPNQITSASGKPRESETSILGITTGRKSGRPPRVEVLVRADRRRRWSAERKREIVAESLEAGCKPGEVAQRHGISTGQLYTWRREMLGVQRALTRSEPPCFAPVEVTPEADRAAAALPKPEMPMVPVRPAGLIEILLPSGVSLRVDAEVDARALRRVLGALSER